MAASAPPSSNGADELRGPFSQKRIAALLDVHRNTVAKWIDEGCPVVQRADRDRGIEWELSLPEIVEWRISRSVQSAVAGYQGDAGLITKEEADRRRAVANAITAEISADEALRSVVSRHDAVADMATFCQVLKTGLANMAAKVAARATTMTNASEIEAMAQTEMNRAFTAAREEIALRWFAKRDAEHDAGGSDQPSSEG
ncbi:Terminase small subunit (DNA packaging protein Nu1) [Methylobacterium sp. DB1607]|nr:Terminase small subunit (DNA packaging protein Nu1) [Methylobacterium sp. DB1607]